MGTVSTFDNAADWSWTSKVFHTDNFLSCPFGAIQNGIRAFDFVRAQDGTYYFAVADWNSGGNVATMHLFKSEGSGVPIDTEVGSLAISWQEFCPGAQNTPDGGPITGGPAGNWTAIRFLCANTPPPFATAAALMFPALATDGVNRLSLVYLTGVDALHFHATYQGNILPRTATTAFQTIDPLGASTFQPSTNGLLQRSAMTSWGPQGSQSCGSAADFYPAWPFVSRSITAIDWAHVSL